MARETKKKTGLLLKIAAWIFMILAVEAALFLLWAWVSYRVRFSAEVVRTGLLFLRILPVILAAAGLIRLKKTKSNP